MRNSVTPTPAWEISPARPEQPEAAAVLRRYYVEIVNRYWQREVAESVVDMAMAEEPSDDLVPPTGLFLVATAGGRTVGCVGLRLREPGTAALTRMYVDAAARGQGGGSRLLRAAEREARALGIRRLRLDTRNDLVEARGLYAKNGYAEVEPFWEATYGEHFFEKHID
ncbi:GNAT family N-acetyltransferase [Amycolatopsis nigrescens]|uniref:GNAT family N-acetyltransferase n=1 Tax=Amycolatopsis nigrescens TaxID=381445 RepID=UPI0003753EF7|nr:GNAT family N-acetyltransferase [Amycolatopsis nigrescens]